MFPKPVKVAEKNNAKKPKSGFDRLRKRTKSPKPSRDKFLGRGVNCNLLVARSAKRI